MKEKTKKRLITYTLIVVWLVGCYFIGQKIHPKTEGNTTEETTPASTTEENTEPGPIETEKAAESEIAVSFINNQEVSKVTIPWGITAGTITMEDDSQAWFLTPETGLQFETANGVTLRCRIHPWMKDISDGGSLRIEYSENTEILTVDHEWKQYHIPENAGTVRIDAQSTDNNDGDWVIIQLAEGE